MYSGVVCLKSGSPYVVHYAVWHIIKDIKSYANELANRFVKDSVIISILHNLSHPGNPRNRIKSFIECAEYAV